MNKKKFYLHLNINSLEAIPPYLKLAAKYPEIGFFIAVTEQIINQIGDMKIIKINFDHWKKKYQINNAYLHLDHGKTEEICQKAIENGFDAIMFDGSELSIEKNISISKKLASQAKKVNVQFEMEIGIINNIKNKHFSKLNDIILINKNVKADWLAIAIGNYHGMDDNEPELNFSLLKEIKKNTNIPLVLHGASGIDGKILNKTITLGIKKINFDTILQKQYFIATQKLINILKNKNKVNYQNIIIEIKKHMQEELFNHAENILKKILKIY